MAIERDHTTQSIVITGVYWCIGPFAFDFFNEVATITILPYLSEALRRQQLTEDQLALPSAERVLLHTPIRLPELGPKTMNVPGHLFQQYFATVIPEPGQTLLDALKAAIWKYAKEVPEPFGLANHFKDGHDV